MTSVTCTKCKQTPGYHSFTHCGTIGHRSIYYTAPARADHVIKTHAEYLEFKSHLDEASRDSWIWIFDCKDMKTKHFLPFEICRELITYVLREHGTHIEEVVVLHPNMWLKGILKLLSPFFKDHLDKIVLVEGDGIEAILGLEKRGIRGGVLMNLRRYFK